MKNVEVKSAQSVSASSSAKGKMKSAAADDLAREFEDALKKEMNKMVEELERKEFNEKRE